MDLAVVLAGQAGVLSLAQARAAGLSDQAARRRVASGQWVRVLPRVYRSASHPPTDDARIWAAALWVGAAGPDGTARATGASDAPGAVGVPAAAPGALSGATAAYVLGLLPRAPLHLEVTVGTARRVQAPPGIRVRRKDLGPADLVRRRGVRTTALPLTVLEAALAVPDAAAFVDRALQRHVDLDSLVAAYRRHRGSRGWARLRPLVAAAHDRTAAESERRFLALLRRSGLTGWVVNLRAGPWEADVAFPEARLAIEIDGWAWHVDTDRFQGDRRKQNALVVAGWTVLRFTWQDVTTRPDHVLALVHRALADRRVEQNVR